MCAEEVIESAKQQFIAQMDRLLEKQKTGCRAPMRNEQLATVQGWFDARYGIELRSDDLYVVQYGETPP